MSLYRNKLPQLEDRPFLTDGGLETTLVFHKSLDLPCFAAFDLLKDDHRIEILREYFEPYLDAARRHQTGFILEAPTWRANPDWAAQLGYDAEGLADANRRAIGLMFELRKAHAERSRPFVISGNLGPRGDGYRADARMTADEARAYHAGQVETFAGTDADMIAAFTMTYASTRSHAELDESADLDDGDPARLGEEYRELKQLLPKLNILGGCCGTDHRHVQAIAAACCGEFSGQAA